MRAPLIAFTLLLFCSKLGFACSCISAGAPACSSFTEYESGAIFVGTVDRITPTQQPTPHGETFQIFRVSLTVKQSYAGAGTKVLEVITGRGGGDCGYEFEVGREYLVFARRNPESGVLGVSICSPTKSIEGAHEDLAYLNSRKNMSRTGRIFGDVMDFMVEGGRRFARTKVLLTSGSATRTAETDADGHFDVSDLAPGKYRVHVQVPGYLARDSEVEVRERGCSEAWLNLAPDSRVAGRVIEHNGQAAAHITVEMLPADGPPQWIQAETDGDGRYAFQGVRSGKYLIAVNGSASPTPKQPYAATFYPDVHERTKGMVISLANTEHREGLDIHLGSRLPEQEFRGHVFYPDGTTAGKANVVYETADYHVPAGIQSGTDGSFHFSGFAGSVFRVRATATAPDGGYFQSEPLETKGDHEIRLVLVLIRPSSIKIDGVHYGSQRPNAVRMADPKPIKP